MSVISRFVKGLNMDNNMKLVIFIIAMIFGCVPLGTGIVAYFMFDVPYQWKQQQNKTKNKTW